MKLVQKQDGGDGLTWLNAVITGADLTRDEVGGDLTLRIQFLVNKLGGSRVLTVVNASTASVASVMKDVGVVAFSQLRGQPCQVGCSEEAVEGVRGWFEANDDGK